MLPKLFLRQRSAFKGLLQITALMACLHGLCFANTEAPADSAALPLTWEEHQKLGLQKADHGEYAEAIVHFDKAALEAEEQGALDYNRGKCHMELGEHEDAIKNFESALSSEDLGVRLSSQFQIATVHYLKAFKSSGNTEQIELDVDQLMKSSFAFQEVQAIGRRHDQQLSRDQRELVAKASRNLRNIAAKYKHHLDQQSRERGSKTPVVQGSVKVNGRAVKGAKVYIKSKWEDRIYGHVIADEGGSFKFDDLKPGQYQLAPALYNTKEAEHLNWGEPLKVPTREKDLHDQNIQGVMTLAAPYQSSVQSLEAPWDDHLRDSGAQSIISSTDWGELTDGFPSEALPTDHDTHLAYVSFDAPEWIIAIGVPSQEQQQQAQQVEKSTEPTPPPTFAVTLKGFHDGDQCLSPDEIKVMGMKEGLEQPTLLYEANIQTTDAGLFEYRTEEFAHQDCRSLMLHLKRSGGQRTSLHEIEVRENLHQKNDQQQDQEQQDQDQQNQDQNQDQQQDQQQDQEQQNQDQKQDQQQQKPEPQESRSTRAILQKIKEKNEEAKEKNKASGIIISTDKDY